MAFPDFIQSFPELDIPFDPEVVTTRALAAPAGLTVFFDVHKDTEIAPHRHGAQWGIVLRGALELTMNGQTRHFGPGESYDIPAGVEHGARVTAGSQLIDVFEEHDRYPVKSR